MSLRQAVRAAAVHTNLYIMPSESPGASARCMHADTCLASEKSRKLLSGRTSESSTFISAGKAIVEVGVSQSRASTVAAAQQGARGRGGRPAAGRCPAAQQGGPPSGRSCLKLLQAGGRRLGRSCERV